LAHFRGAFVPDCNYSENSQSRRAISAADLESGLTGDRVRIMSKLCHELRTPLQVLNGYLDILSEDWGKHLTDEPLRIVERLRFNTAELTQTIENLLEYAGTLTGTQAVVVEAVEVADIMRELMPPFEASAQRKKISLRWKVERNVHQIRTDRRLLRSIVSNLVSNAIKFTRRGTVTVRWRTVDGECGDAIELEVADTGEGIDRKRLDEAFEPFVQLSDSNTRHYRGLGLGLALVRRNTISLGATLEVISKPALGTCFKIRFPQGGRS
jgi:signal transduction histidine kinase